MMLPLLSAHILEGRLPSGFIAPSSLTHVELRAAIVAARLEVDMPGVRQWLEILKVDIARHAANEQAALEREQGEVRS
jgi:hypothetical protein